VEGKPSRCSYSNEDPDRQRQPRWLQEMDVVVICDILHPRKPGNSGIQNEHKKQKKQMEIGIRRFSASVYYLTVEIL
jgi:hypothetical protein